MKEVAGRLASWALAVVGLGFAGCTAPSAPGIAAAGAASDQQSAAPQDALGAGPDNPLGLDQAALTRWLGVPSLVRRDDPAEVWQYRVKGCVVELYLYPVDNHMAVIHAEAREPGASGDALKPCLSTLSEERRKAAQS